VRAAAGERVPLRLLAAAATALRELARARMRKALGFGPPARRAAAPPATRCTHARTPGADARHPRLRARSKLQSEVLRDGITQILKASVVRFAHSSALLCRHASLPRRRSKRQR
jgi:hypothetical protein